MSRAMRLALLVCAGLVCQVGWMLVLGLSYRLTHGNEYTFQFLLTHNGLWELLRDQLHPLANQLYPGLEQPNELGPVVPEMAINAFVVACVILAAGYLGAIILLDSGVSAVPGALAVLLGFAIVYQTTQLMTPGLFTTDIFSYVMYGQISAVYNLNPYIYPPNYFPGNALVDPKWIHPIWHDQPTVYGPLWTNLGWLMAQLTAQLSLMDQTFAYKLLMNGVQLVNLALVWWLLGRLMPASPRARITAFAVFAWNPLMLFDTAGNAHNDALMVTLLLLSVVPLAIRHAPSSLGIPDRSPAFSTADPERSPTRPRTAPPRRQAVRSVAISNARWALAIFLVAMSMLVKYTTGLVALFYLIPWLRQLRSWSARVLWLGGTGLAIVTVTGLLFAPWWDYPRVLQPIVTAANGKSWQYSNSAPDVVAMHIDNRLLNPASPNPEAEPRFYQDLYQTATSDSTRANLKWIVRALFAVYLVWECWQLWRRSADPATPIVEATLYAATRALTVLILLVLTWVLEWYWMWPLALATLLGWRNVLTRVVVGYTLTSIPVFYLHHFWSSNLPSWVVLAYALPPLLVPVCTWLGQRARPPRPRLDVSPVLSSQVADASPARGS